MFVWAAQCFGEKEAKRVGNEPLGWRVLALKALGLGAQDLAWPRGTSLPSENWDGEEQSGEVEGPRLCSEPQSCVTDQEIASSVP